MLWEAGGRETEKRNGREGSPQPQASQMTQVKAAPVQFWEQAATDKIPTTLPTLLGTLLHEGLQLLNEIPGLRSTMSIPTLIDH